MDKSNFSHGDNHQKGEIPMSNANIIRDNKLLEAAQRIGKIGGWELNVITGELYWTSETYRIHETTPEEFNPTVDAGVSFFLPESRKIITAALEAAIKDGKGYDLILDTYTTKGNLISVRTTCEVTQQDGQTAKLTGMFQDITETAEAKRLIHSQMEDLKHYLQGTIRLAMNLNELRDPYTPDHENRVAQIALEIAKIMGLPEETAECVLNAGYLHDIGKISIPIDILAKPGKLSPLEFQLVQQHPQTGYDILSEVAFPWPLAEIALQHHERLDGSGYPQGLKGDEIRIESRIISVADVVEAMSTNRPYRTGLGIEAALKEIESGRGSLYDERAVDACLKLFREMKYEFPEDDQVRFSKKLGN